MDSIKPRKPSPFQLEIGNVSARIKQLHQSTERMLELNQQKNKFITDNLRSNKYSSGLPGFAISLLEESNSSQLSQNVQQPEDKSQQIAPQKTYISSQTDRSPVSQEKKNFLQYKIQAAPSKRAISPSKRVKLHEKRSISPISKTMVSRLGTKSPLQQTSFSKFSTGKTQQTITKQPTQANIPKNNQSFSYKEDTNGSLRCEKAPQKVIVGENPYLSRFLNCLNKCEDTKEISNEEQSQQQRLEGMKRCFSFGQQQEEEGRGGKIANIMEKEEETDVVQSQNQFSSVEKKNTKRVQFCNTVVHCFTPHASSSATNSNNATTTPLTFTRMLPFKNSQPTVQNQIALLPHPIIKNISRELKSVGLQNTQENQSKMNGFISIGSEKGFSNTDEIGLNNTIAVVLKNAEDARVNEMNSLQKRPKEIKSGFIDLNGKSQKSYESDNQNTNKIEVDFGRNRDSEKTTEEVSKQPHKTLLEMRQKLVKGCGQGENCFDGGLADFISKTSTIKRASSQEFLDCKHRSSELITDKIQTKNKESSSIVQNNLSNQEEQFQINVENFMQMNDSTQLLLPSTEHSAKQINHLYENSSIKVKNWRLESPSSSNASSSVATTNSASNSTGGLLDLKQSPFIIESSEQRADLQYYQQSVSKTALTRIDLGIIPKEIASSNLLFGSQQSKQIQCSGLDNTQSSNKSAALSKNDNNSTSNPLNIIIKNAMQQYQIPQGFQTKIDTFSKQFDASNNLTEEAPCSSKTKIPKPNPISVTIDNSSLSRYNNTSPNNCCPKPSPKSSASSLCFPLSATNRSSKQQPNRLSFASVSSKYPEQLPQSLKNCQNTPTEQTNPYFSPIQKQEKKDEKSIKTSSLLFTKINNINWEI